jgi:hypothetical protein
MGIFRIGERADWRRCSRRSDGFGARNAIAQFSVRLFTKAARDAA